VIGMRFADGQVVLDPPPDTPIAAGDRIIAVAEDDDALAAESVDVSTWTAGPPLPDERGPERFVVLGWNPIGRLLLSELSHHVAPGSTALVLVDPGAWSADDRAAVEALGGLAVSWREADITASATVQEAMASGDVDHVIILCRRDLTPAESDARTLITLLQLRQATRTIRRRPSVVTELLDVRDVELARTEEADDFVVSEHLSSLMMVQLAENRELAAVFADLFDGKGTDLCLRPVGAYDPPHGPVPFAEIVRSAMERGEAAIGYRSAGRVVLNPAKSEMVDLGEDDHLVVLATTT
jgi:hypothetical protein